MAHEITSTDGFFAVRQPGWHGLGETLEDYPTRALAQSIAHPWEPITEPVYLREPRISDDGYPYSGHEEAPGFQALRRSDNADLLGIVTDSYEPVTNTELWDVAEALQQGAVDVKFETAGSLQGGKKVWILVRLDEPLSVVGDPHGETIPYFALQNSHDGAGSFRGQATMTRIVCANTSKIADLDAKARGTEFTFRHTRKVSDRIEEAKLALAGWRSSLDEWKLMSEHLLTLSIDQADRWEFIERFIPEPRAEIVSDRVRANIAAERDKLSDILDGVTSEGIDLTAYGLVNSVIEYAEHYRRAQNNESRFKRAYLDRNTLVSQGMKLALEVAR